MKDRIGIVKGNVRSLLLKSVDHENAYIAYREHLTEQGALKSRFDNLIQDAARLAENMPDLSSIIDDEIQSLSREWRNFDDELRGFHEDLDDTKDSEALKDDLVSIEEWIETNDTAFGDLEGRSLDEIEEMLRVQDDFEKSIAVQEGRFQSTLGRLSKYTEKVENKYTKRMSVDDKASSAENLDVIGDETSIGKEAVSNSIIEPKGIKNGAFEKGSRQLHAKQIDENKEANGKPVPSQEVKNKSHNNVIQGNFHNVPGKLAKLEEASNSGISVKLSNQDKVHDKLVHDAVVPSSAPRTVQREVGSGTSRKEKEAVQKEAGSGRSRKEKEAVQKEAGSGTSQKEKDTVQKEAGSGTSRKEKEAVQKEAGSGTLRKEKEAVQKEAGSGTSRKEKEAVQKEAGSGTSRKEKDTVQKEAGSGTSRKEKEAVQKDAGSGTSRKEKEAVQKEAGSGTSRKEKDTVQKETGSGTSRKEKDTVQKEAGSGTSRKEKEMVPGPRKKNEIPNSSFDGAPLSSHEKKKRDVQSVKRDTYPDKSFSNKKSPDNNEKAVKSTVFDNASTGPNKLYDIDDSAVELAACPVADSPVRNPLPSIPSATEDILQTRATSEPFGEDSIQHKIPVDFPEEPPRADLLDEVVVPDQALFAESSIDFAFLDDSDLSDEDEVPVTFEDHFEKGVGIFKPILNDEEDRSPEISGTLNRDEINNNQKTGGEDQRVNMSNTNDKDIFSQDALDATCDDEIEVDIPVAENLRHQEKDSRPNSKDFDHESKSIDKMDLEDDLSTGVRLSNQVHKTPLSERASDVDRNSQIPAILVSRPSNTENEISHQLSLEASDHANIDFEGNMEFKEETTRKGKPSLARKWKDLYCIIIGSVLICYDTEELFRKNAAPRKELDLEDAMVSVEPGISSNTLRLVTADKSEFLVRSIDTDILNHFLMAVSECTRMSNKEDTVSLPPAPPPPSMPQDIGGDDLIIGQTQIREVPGANMHDFNSPESGTRKPAIPPPEISSDGM